MSIEQRVADALQDLDDELRAGTAVTVAIAEMAKSHHLAPHVLQLRAEKQFGSLTRRRRWHAVVSRARKDVADFLTEQPINTDWQTRVHMQIGYESFLSRRYKKKVSVQRLALAEDALEAAFMRDLESRRADRKARGVRLRNW